ncbi:MAG: hypothetical protein RLP13_00010, partial [Cytophagales bacterium]
YGTSQTDKQIISIDPNSFDLDPVQFYERITDEFKIEIDFNTNPYFGGLGGSVSNTIDFIFKHSKKNVKRTDPNNHLFSFFDNFESNFKTFNTKNVTIYFHMYSMMEGHSAAKQVKEKLKIALQNNDWSEIIQILLKVKQKKLIFDLDSIKKVVAELK